MNFGYIFFSSFTSDFYLKELWDAHLFSQILTDVRTEFYDASFYQVFPPVFSRVCESL